MFYITFSGKNKIAKNLRIVRNTKNIFCRKPKPPIPSNLSKGRYLDNLGGYMFK